MSWIRSAPCIWGLLTDDCINVLGNLSGPRTPPSRRKRPAGFTDLHSSFGPAPPWLQSRRKAEKLSIDLAEHTSNKYDQPRSATSHFQKLKLASPVCRARTKVGNMHHHARTQRVVLLRQRYSSRLGCFESNSLLPPPEFFTLSFWRQDPERKNPVLCAHLFDTFWLLLHKLETLSTNLILPGRKPQYQIQYIIIYEW